MTWDWKKVLLDGSGSGSAEDSWLGIGLMTDIDATRGKLRCFGIFTNWHNVEVCDLGSYKYKSPNWPHLKSNLYFMTKSIPRMLSVVSEITASILYSLRPSLTVWAFFP